MSGGPDTPELSIIVPVYNVEPWITQCLNSIQRQTFEAWECILVDDGSPDLSGHIRTFKRRPRCCASLKNMHQIAKRIFCD